MEEYLGETLDSVLASDYPDLEIILMDDGSKDRSLEIARQYAKRYPNIQVHTQQNSGVCVARNEAIAKATGKYILPVDADNRIAPFFISQAVDALEADEDLKVVCCRAEFFGDRSGIWRLPEFSLSLLARKNMMDTCAVYRKSDWERVGGYCKEIIAREDWEFWISVLKDGGKVLRLPQVGLYYRIRSGSKRVSDRALKKHVIDVLNKRHPEFFLRELGGPLRYQRSWSRVLNAFSRLVHPCKLVVNPAFKRFGSLVCSLPVLFDCEGIPLYKGRNELKIFERDGTKLVVKSYQIPHLLNRIIYGTFRSSKAERAYRYAELLNKIGVCSPAPVGYYFVKTGFLFGHSYFVSLKSECPYSYRDFAKSSFARQDDILRAIARVTATLHEHGILHKDYSAGNILFKENTDGEIHVEIIDLNRMRFGKVSMEEGCRNFERLPGSAEMIAVMADEYARCRGFEADKCRELIMKACMKG